jgi:hypothetical protein
VVWSTARGGRVLGRLLRSARRPVPAPVEALAAELGIADRVEMVAAREPFAVTHGRRGSASRGTAAGSKRTKGCAGNSAQRRRAVPARLLPCRRNRREPEIRTGKRSGCSRHGARRSGHIS